MAGGKSNSSFRTSSEISLVPDVFCVSYSESMPVNSPDSLCSTEMPKPFAIFATDPNEEQQDDSRWKPLIGTPSKPPLPKNILVPDRSPARDVADDESPYTLASSTPGSFIHRRRQGEYVPRPPVWKIYDPQEKYSSAGNEFEDTGTETCESDEDVFTNSQCHNVPDMKLVGTHFAKQVKEMADEYSETPDIVEEMEAAGLTVAHGTLYDARWQFRVIADSTVSDGVASKPEAYFNATQHLVEIPQIPRHRNLLRNGSASPKTASNVKALRRKSTRSSGSRSASDNSLTVPIEKTPKLSQDEIKPPSADPTRFWQDQGSRSYANNIHDSPSQIPQLPLDSTHSQTESVTSCTNPTQKMALRKYMMSGYLVKYVGNTVYLAGQLSGEPEPDDTGRFMIAATYDDAWALVIKRDSGQKLKRTSIALSNGTDQEGEVAMVEVLYDERLLRFLPLCSLHAIDEYTRLKQGKLLIGERQMCTQGGKVRPPIRRQTMVAEDEAKNSGVIQIPRRVFYDFKHRCERPRCTRRLPNDLLPFCPKLARTSSQEVPVGLSSAETQEEINERQARRRTSHEGNPLFTQWSRMTPEQIAQSQPYNTNNQPSPDYDLRQPIGHEDYLAQQDTAAESYRRKQVQKQRDDERHRPDEQTGITQRPSIWGREHEGNGTSIATVTLDHARDSQPNIHLHSSASIQEVLPTVASTRGIRFSNDETAVQAAHSRTNSCSLITTNATAAEPRGSSLVREVGLDEETCTYPDDAASKRGRGHPEKTKENKPFPMRSLTKSIGRGLGKVKSKLLSKSGRSKSPGPVSLQMAPRVKPALFGKGRGRSECESEDGGAEV